MCRAKLLPIVDKELKGCETGRKLAVKEYRLEETGQVTIKSTGSWCDIAINGRPIKHKEPRILEFKETATDSNRFERTDSEPILYDPADQSTFWGKHEIKKSMVTRALNVCHETYDDTWNAINPRNLPEPGAIQEREVFGKTRCIIRHYPEEDTLYIGFRGSADKDDWITNIKFELVSFNKLDCVKVHKGFKERSDNILEELPAKILGYEPLPAKIVTSGHSLGAAISQLIHIQLDGKLKNESKCELINITFAPPMVGNLNLRNLLSLEAYAKVAKSMYHFVVAEDIVPASLFIEHTRQKIHLYDWVLRLVINKYLGEENKDLAQEVNEQLSKLKVPENKQPVFNQANADSQYSPIGNYFYIKDCVQLKSNVK